MSDITTKFVFLSSIILLSSLFVLIAVVQKGIRSLTHLKKLRKIVLRGASRDFRINPRPFFKCVPSLREVVGPNSADTWCSWTRSEDPELVNEREIDYDLAGWNRDWFKLE